MADVLETGIARARAANVVLRPQTKPELLDAIARLAGARLPDDFVSFYSRFDGAEGIGVAEHRDLMSLEEIRDEWQLLRDVWSEIEDHGTNRSAAVGIARVMWNAGWVPFATDGGGNLTCVDVSPDLAARGRMGQVISYWNSEPDREIVSASFAEWLAAVEWTP